MYLFHLKYFLEVSKCGSLNKAAQNLHLTQPALSQAIASLESYLGFSLFSRSKSGVVLTKEGKSILAEAENIVLTIEGWKTEFADNRDESETVQIVAIPFIATDILYPIFNQLLHDHPNITYEIQRVSRYHITEQIAHAEASIGIFTDLAQNLEEHMNLLKQMNYKADVLLNDRYVFYAREDNIIFNDIGMKQYNQLSFLCGYNAAMHGLNEEIENAFPKIHRMAQPFIIDDISMIKAVAQNAMSIGYINESKINDQIETLFKSHHLKVLDETKFFVPIQHYCVHRYDRLLSVGERIFINRLKKYYERNGGLVSL